MFTTLQNKRTSYAICYFEQRVAVFCFKNILKMTLMSGKENIQIQHVSYAKFLILFEKFLLEERKRSKATKCVIQ